MCLLRVSAVGGSCGENNGEVGKFLFLVVLKPSEDFQAVFLSQSTPLTRLKHDKSTFYLSPPPTNHQFTCIINKNESKKRRVIVIVVTRFVISHLATAFFTASEDIALELLLMSRKV
jgi:hypothetical protein